MIPLMLAALFAVDPRPAALDKRHWDCRPLPHFQVCGTPGLGTDFLEDQAEAALQDTLRFVGAPRYPHRIYLLVVHSPGDLQALTAAYANGASHPEEHAIFLVKGHPENLVHEMNHEVVTGLWGKSEFWIAEGLAAYASDPKTIDEQCRVAYSERWSLKLSDMVTPTWNAAQDPYPARAIYPMLGSFVKYLLSGYGLERVHQVWQGGSQSIPKVFGKTLSELDRDWRATLATDRGR